MLKPFNIVKYDSVFAINTSVIQPSLLFYYIVSHVSDYINIINTSYYGQSYRICVLQK